MKQSRLPTTILAGIASLLGTGAATAAPAPVTFTIHADTPGAVINPAIYGQFAEHWGD
jgi:alpha-N-arabinofuranosidase